MKALPPSNNTGPRGLNTDLIIENDIRFAQQIRWWERFALLFVKSRVITDDYTGGKITFKEWNGKSFLLKTEGPYYPKHFPNSGWTDVSNGIGNFPVFKNNLHE